VGPSRIGAAVVLVFMGLGLGCGGPGVFACVQDSQCSGGSCVENSCAFPDEGCGSALRFGEHAGDLAGQCVPEPGEVETGSASSATSASVSGSATSTAGTTVGLDAGPTEGGSSEMSSGPADTSADASVGSSGDDLGTGSDTAAVLVTLELVSNGDFADGTTGWNAHNNPDSLARCTSFPDDEDIVFSDGGGYLFNGSSEGPSAHAIVQDILVPMGITSASFSLEYAQNNGSALDPENVETIIKDCVDKNMDGAEQNAFRIDLIDPRGDVFLAPILFELGAPTASTTNVGELPDPPMTETLANAEAALLTFLQSNEGTLLRLRIAQVESTMPWQIAIDDVSLVVDALQ
jgi:hypothetical protein